MKTLVLLSGGLDSTVILATLAKNGHECAAIGFDYKQPHVELDCAAAIAAHYGVPFEIILLPALPKSDEVVIVGRNLLFIAVAVPLAHRLHCQRIAIGCNSTDWQRFPDCRPVFWSEIKRAVDEAYGVNVVTPLLHYTKIDVVQMAREMAVPIDMTWSCYAPTPAAEPCGKCLACTTRRDALEWQHQAS